MGLLQRLFGHHHGRGHHRDGLRGQGSAAPAAVAAICPGCHASIASSAHFCPQCGSPVLPRSCRHCSASQPAGARFCGQCGQPIAA